MAKCSIKVELVNDSYSELRGEIAGPPDTPYQGGNFHLEIKIPETYPFNPPKVSSLLVLTLSPIYGTIFGMVFAVECVGQNNLQIVHYLAGLKPCMCFQCFGGPELGPKFSPIPNWEFSNILPNVDQKFPIVFKKKTTLDKLSKFSRTAE